MLRRHGGVDMSGKLPGSEKSFVGTLMLDTWSLNQMIKH